MCACTQVSSLCLHVILNSGVICAGSLANDIEELSNETAANFAIRQLKRILPDADEPVRTSESRWIQPLENHERSRQGLYLLATFVQMMSTCCFNH